MYVKLGAVHVAGPSLRPTTQATYKTSAVSSIHSRRLACPCSHWMMLSGCPFWATCPGSEAVEELGMLL